MTGKVFHVMTVDIPYQAMIVITVSIVTGTTVLNAAPTASHAIRPFVWGVLMNVHPVRCRSAKIAQRPVKIVKRYFVRTA